MSELHAHAHAHDHHGHGHDHDHHDHSRVPADRGRAFLIGIGLNLAIVGLEVVMGVMSHSMALLADAGHNLSDVLGLVLAWGAIVLARRAPSARRTYGFRKSSILAALANAVLLLVATGGVVWESVGRLGNPPAVEGKSMIVVAAIAVVCNGVSALFFMRDRKRDLNVRSAFIHLMGDAAIAGGVVVTGIIILNTGWRLIDPLVSILISLLILVGTWSLLKRSIDLVLDSVPEGIDPAKVRAYLAALPGVVGVHDLHIWPMSTTETALTAHLVTAQNANQRDLIRRVSGELQSKFEIEHATIQVEAEDGSSGCEPHCA